VPVEPFEAIGLRKDGTRFHGEVRARTIAYQGRGACVAAIRDITQRVQQSAKQEALLHENARLIVAAQGAIRLRDQVLASVAHDLRAPLTNIRLGAELLREKTTSDGVLALEQVAADLRKIEVRATRMGRQLNELLDVARVQMEQDIVLDRRPTDLANLVRQVVGEFQAAGGPPLHVSVAAGTVGFWDAGRLERVLANLLRNAHAYSPAATAVTLTADHEPEPGGGWAVVCVRDLGLGIPATDLPHIGEPFYRAANVRGRIAGTGLGLAGCRRIVELHGGTLHLESEEGVGTTVTVRLPLDFPTAQPVREVHPSGAV